MAVLQLLNQMIAACSTSQYSAAMACDGSVITDMSTANKSLVGPVGVAVLNAAIAEFLEGPTSIADDKGVHKWGLLGSTALQNQFCRFLLACVACEIDESESNITSDMR